MKPIIIVLFLIFIMACEEIHIMTDHEFDTYLDNCYTELQDKQSKIQEKYDIGSYEEFFYDQGKKVLQFKNDNIIQIQFSVVFIGSWAKHKNDWLWAWANKSMTESVRKDSEQLKQIAKTTGLEVFESTNIEADEYQAWELTALSIKELDAIGVYKVPGERSDLFIGLIQKLD